MQAVADHARCLFSTFSFCTLRAGTWRLNPTASGVFINFLRHRNEAAQALQSEFRWQDDGISMITP